MLETWVQSPGEGNDYQFQYSSLENSMDCIVHGVTRNQTRLSDFHFTSLHGCMWDFPGDSDSKESAYNAGDWVKSLGW